MKKLTLGLIVAITSLTILSCRETTEEKTEDALNAIGKDIKEGAERAADEIEEGADRAAKKVEKGAEKLEQEIDEEIHETDDQTK